jgi:uroporphyrin-III C-methyltransferase
LTAGIAGPAAMGVPVTDRRYSRGVALVTGHTGQAHDEPDWAALARCGLTLVIYMGVQRLQNIADALTQAGLPADTPAAVVCSAHTPAQRQAVCTLGSLVATVQAQGLHSPAIVVVGDVVKASPHWSAHLQNMDADTAALAPGVAALALA